MQTCQWIQARAPKRELKIQRRGPQTEKGSVAGPAEGERREISQVSKHWAPKLAGLFYGDTKQFEAQVIGALVNAIWAFGATFIVFKIVNTIKSMRVSADVELEGLDVPEFGALAYPDDGISNPEMGAMACLRSRASAANRRAK